MDDKSHYLGPTRSKDKNVSDGTEKRIDYTIALLLTIDNDTKKNDKWSEYSHTNRKQDKKMEG